MAAPLVLPAVALGYLNTTLPEAVPTTSPATNAVVPNCEYSRLQLTPP
jgi:hypothetical protein